MSAERFLLDTSFIQALLNKQDPYHHKAAAFFPRVRKAREVWVTEAVLIEVGNALSARDRTGAIRFIQQCERAANIHVVPVDHELFEQAFTLYQTRPDKAWGLTDCISFVVMEQHGLTAAVTMDSHFIQAGYHALLAESAP